jgi:hypothetical protein
MMRISDAGSKSAKQVLEEKSKRNAQTRALLAESLGENPVRAGRSSENGLSRPLLKKSARRAEAKKYRPDGIPRKR